MSQSDLLARSVLFRELPHALAERLLGSIEGWAEPLAVSVEPLADRETGSPWKAASRKAATLTLVGAACMTAALLMSVRYGEPCHSREGAWLYSSMFAVSLVALFGMLRMLRERLERCPVPEGRYCFEDGELEVVGDRVVSVDDEPVLRAIARLTHVPLECSGSYRDAPVPTEPIRSRKLALEWLALPMAFCVLPVVAMRNAMSDSAAVRSIRDGIAADTIDVARCYLASSGAHRIEVERFVLSPALFERARSEHDLISLIAEVPGTIEAQLAARELESRQHPFQMGDDSSPEIASEP